MKMGADHYCGVYERSAHSVVGADGSVVHYVAERGQAEADQRYTLIKSLLQQSYGPLMRQLLSQQVRLKAVDRVSFADALVAVCSATQATAHS